MLPTAYEFHWDIGHIVFLGVFYSVLTAVITVLAVASYRGLRDLGKRRAVAIEWEESFHDLPLERRHCRHEFDGTASCRICEHGFDCATCSQHPLFVAQKGDAVAEAVPPVGMGLAADRLYHRGHTWVEPRPDGTLTVGLDEFAERCFGRPDHVLLPAVGSYLQAEERGVVLERGSLLARVASPVAGEVVAQGGSEAGWLYRVRPLDPEPPLENLLRGEETRVWMLRELEWLQRILSPAGEIPTLADGGAPVGDLVQAYPEADWDSIWGQVCLEA